MHPYISTLQGNIEELHKEMWITLTIPSQWCWLPWQACQVLYCVVVGHYYIDTVMSE